MHFLNLLLKAQRADKTQVYKNRHSKDCAGEVRDIKNKKKE